MSALNVLAVMDESASLLNAVDSDEGSYLDTKALALKEARTAVAELIRREAILAETIADLRTQCVNNLDVGALGVGYWTDALETIDGALAACKEQS